MALKWSRDLQTGFERIDDQHKVLIAKLTEFHMACEDGRGRSVLGKMLVFIDNYVQAHFLLEEALMVSKNYPEIAEHRAAHERLREEYKRLVGALVEDGAEPPVVMKTNVFLNDWWIEHISKMDKKMVKFIQKEEKRHGGAL